MSSKGFLFRVFYDTVSQTVIESCDTVFVNGELESNWKEAFVAYSRYCPGCLEQPEKKANSPPPQDSQCVRLRFEHDTYRIQV